MVNPITAIVAFVAGFGTCLLITRRLVRQAAPATPAAPAPQVLPDEPDLEAVRAEPPVVATARHPDVDRAVADAIFTVADRLTSADLRQRLEQAASLLPGVTVLRPEPGTKFDPSRHEWVQSRPAPSPEAVETVAETINAGLVDRDGTVLRPARVIAYDTPKE